MVDKRKKPMGKAKQSKAKSLAAKRRASRRRSLEGTIDDPRFAIFTGTVFLTPSQRF